MQPQKIINTYKFRFEKKLKLDIFLAHQMQNVLKGGV